MSRSLLGKVILVTGGTGSIGKVAVARAVEEGAAEVRVLSRDEQKHVEIRRISSRVHSYIGDVRDFDRVYDAARGVDFIFHAAAMKHVPECERDPLEAVKTNVLGSENVLRAAELRNVECVVSLSTDKAVEPTSVMGMSKAMMERLALSEDRKFRSCVVRFGNVIGTRGSVLPLFEHLIQQNLPILVTDPGMRRFLMTPTQAVNLVMGAYKDGESGDIFIHEAPVATVGDMAIASTLLAGLPEHPIKIIGPRQGEKFDEALATLGEMDRAYRLGDFIVIARDKSSVIGIDTVEQPTTNRVTISPVILGQLLSIVKREGTWQL